MSSHVTNLCDLIICDLDSFIFLISLAFHWYIVLYAYKPSILSCLSMCLLFFNKPKYELHHNDVIPGSFLQLSHGSFGSV